MEYLGLDSTCSDGAVEGSWRSCVAGDRMLSADVRSEMFSLREKWESFVANDGARACEFVGDYESNA